MGTSLTRQWDASGKSRKPRVLCIGAQKAGTSWLHEQLNSHPAIWTTPFKEVHYFNARHRPGDRKWMPWHFRQAIRATELRFDARKQQMPDELVRYLLDMTQEPMFTPGWYRRAFAPAPRRCLPLDTTPEYSTLPPEGVAEVAAFLPRARFIYLIRDPVSRAISQLRMNLSRRRKLPRTQAGYLAHLDDPDLADRGDYATYVPRWRAHFGPDRLLFLPYGRIATDPLGLMREVEAFLGLSAHDYPRLRAQIHRGASAPAFPDAGREILRARFAAQYDFLAANFDAGFNAALDAPPSPRPAAPKTRAAAPSAPDETAGWAQEWRAQKPSVIGIGAQKSGTTWLHGALSQHPGLFSPPMKEAHYFDHLFCPENRGWTPGHVAGAARSILARHDRAGREPSAAMMRWLDRLTGQELFTDDWYQSLFAPAPPGTRPLDITPAYSGLPPKGVDHVASYLPKAQFIYLIRDPVDRAISQLRMNLTRANRLPADEAGWLRAANDKVLAARGDYASYVPRWQARFGPDRLLILPYGLIAADPAGLMRRIEGFLGLPPHRYTGLDRRVFAARGAEVPDSLRDVLAERFAPQYAFLASHFDAAFNAALR